MPIDLTQPLDLLPDPLALEPIAPASMASCAPAVQIRPPGSKSLTNRALLLAALSHGRSVLSNPLVEADDAQRMIEALRLLGATITFDEAAKTLTILGVDGRWPLGPDGVELQLQNAGTATRFLAAAAALAHGPVTIDGNSRMRERPIGELGDVLPELGCRIDYLTKRGYPPIRLMPQVDSLDHELTIELCTTQSSQFISALLMLGPWLKDGITLRLLGSITSPPYIWMTLRLLDKLGARVQASEDLHVLRIGPPAQRADGALGLEHFSLTLEPDASGATYFWAAGALLPGRAVSVLGLGIDSLQGDAAFPKLLAQMGARIEMSPPHAQARSELKSRRHIPNRAPPDTQHDEPRVTVTGPKKLKPITVDLADMPDAAMTLAAVCVFAEGRSELRGLRTLRVKETDRIAALQTELRKLGVRVETDIPGDPDAISITPPPDGVDCAAACERIEFETYDDHRMAMSLALIGLRRPNCFLRDPGCVRKTYPSFWADFGQLFRTV